MVPAGISARRFLRMIERFAGFPTPERITASAALIFIGQIKRKSTASLEIYWRDKRTSTTSLRIGNYYVVTAVDAQSHESSFSSEFSATIPSN
jgi:hypothetical protein